MERERSQLIVETTIALSSSNPWNLLPDDTVCLIFKNLWIGDRVRSRLVCKSWKQILTQEYIPKMPEAPWEILSNDSYNKQESCLTEIRFKSPSEQRIYNFRLPPLIIGNQLGGWLCGSSRGWLLITVGPISNADMFLWQPVSGDTRKLPPPSTLPFFNEYIELGMTGGIDNLSSVIHRVEVFSMDSSECIVAVIFRRDTCDEVALCTPQEKTWKVFVGGNFKLRCSDILFHSTCRELCILVTSISPEYELNNFLLDFNCEVRLTNCRIPVSKIVAPCDDQDVFDAQFLQGLQLAYPYKQIAHLVESSLTKKFLIVFALFGCVASENNADNQFIARFRCPQTTGFIVRSFDTTKRYTEILSSIGEEAIFIGAAGSFSTLPLKGVEADCIYFGTDDAKGVAFHNGANKHYIIREHGLFSLQRDKIEQISFTTVKYRSGFRVGWFMPKL